MKLNGGFPMTEQAPVLTRHDLEAKIVKRCWEDEGFRKEFTADPAGAFVKYLRVPAASLPKIAIHQEIPGSWHIVLPTKPSDPSELSEQDLEKVAGGTTGVCVLTAVVVSASGLSASLTVVEGGW
jgi:hypothetical protein